VNPFRVISCRALRHLLLMLTGIVSPLLSAAPPAAGPVAVEVIEVTAGDALIQREIPGRTSPFKVAEIRPQVTGIITERLFEEGTEVSEGQQLYQIDAAPYEAVFKKAQADLQKARANEKAVLVKQKRLRELVSSKSVSQQEFDDVQANLDLARADIAIAEAAISQARVDLDNTRISAPIAGRIGKSQFTRGALVIANQTQALTRITQLDPVYVDMTLSSNELMQVRPFIGSVDQVRVRLILEYDGSEYDHEGHLQFADVTVDATTGSVAIRALFDNPDWILLPGMFVRSRLELPISNAFLIPQKAAQRDSDGSLYLWQVDENNKAKKLPVRETRSIGNQWLIKDGLSGGEKIVTAGMLKLSDGADVSLGAAAAK
jgi:membrane fusion protein (multidrug efflux system)